MLANLFHPAYPDATLTQGGGVEPAGVARDEGDPELLRRVAGGDPQAFEVLVRRHERWARRYAARALGDETEAEDVVQDVLVALWKQAPTLPHNTEARAWILMVLTRRLIDVRRRRRAEPMAEVPERASTAPSAADLASDAEERALLARLIAQLDVRQRTALLLVLDEGRTLREGAEAMNMHPKGFESLVQRAREKLASWWRKGGPA